MSKIMKRILNAVTTILISLMVLLVALLWGSKLLGFEIFVVQSGSMEPAYHVGSLVYVKPVDMAELQAGDVITFHLDGGIRGTHRIVEVLDENDSLAFRTKGDANADADHNPVLPEDVIGQVKFTIPYLGILVTYIQQPPGTYITISIVAVLLLLLMLPDLIIFIRKPKGREDSL